MKNRKAQATIEMLIILAVSLIVIIAVLELSQDSLNIYDSMITQTKTKTLFNDISSYSKLVYQQGYGAKTKVYVTIPENVHDINISNRTMVVKYINGNRRYHNFDFEVIGDLPTEHGNYWVELQAMKSFVIISTNVSAISHDYATCGNNKAEIGEECDGTDLKGKSCETFGYAFGGLSCDSCRIDTSGCKSLNAEICDDGIDNDNDGLVDCEDPNCIGNKGPSGRLCCAGSSVNCPGIEGCRTCNPENECVNEPITTVCNTEYRCSFSGDNGYDMQGNVPSQSYCDGKGYCDFAMSSPLCSYYESDPEIIETSGTNICFDGVSYCIDACNDGIDNDGDGLIDSYDGGCGGIELNCGDGIDNDGDGLIDCDDPDCNGAQQFSGELADEGIDETQTNPEGIDMHGNVLLLHLNENSISDSKTISDFSGKTYDGIFNADDTDNKSIDGKLFGSVRLDGSKDYIQIDEVIKDIHGQDFTILLWTRKISNSGQQFVISINTATGGNRLLLGHQAGKNKLSLHTTPSGRWNDANNDIVDGEWHHIGYTFNKSAGRIIIYFDGEADSTISYSDSVALTDQFVIGADYDSNLLGDWWNGDIDELALWNKTLTHDEIRKIYNRAKDCEGNDCYTGAACGFENCTDGIDNDGNGLTDCQDSKCFGMMGPNNKTCCGTDTAYCGGTAHCSSCNANNECAYSPNTTICNIEVMCSAAGDDGYRSNWGRIPSQGYCDGQGNCDLAASRPLCDLNKSAQIESSGVTMCTDGGYLGCIDTCNDGIDNDEDGCIDEKDSDCGGTEPMSLCSDGKDNDCDALIDCDDPDCATYQFCVDYEVNCTNGIDDDNDGKIDCEDTDCFGKIGPDGNICCGSDKNNCPGHNLCKSCGPNKECSYFGPSVACNMTYRCSTPGDDGYDTDGNIPSQGYCDGYGNCDFASSSPACVFFESNLETSLGNVCIDGQNDCVETCIDNTDNDGDSLTDCDDMDCKVTLAKDANLPDNNEDETTYRLDGVDMTGNILLFHFDEAYLKDGSTVHDSSGYSSNGVMYTNNGADDKTVEGKLNHAVTFDGNGDYIALSKYYQGEGIIHSVTACAWFRTSDSGSWDSNWALIDFDRSEYYNLYVNGNGKLSFSSSSKSKSMQDFDGISIYNDGQWHFGCAVFNTTHQMIYGNGELDNIAPSPHDGLALGTGLKRYGFIGEGSEADSFDGRRNNKYYKGDIDELAVWERALNPAEISTIYERTKDCHFDTCPGSEFCS